MIRRVGVYCFGDGQMSQVCNVRLNVEAPWLRRASVWPPWWPKTYLNASWYMYICCCPSRLRDLMSPRRFHLLPAARHGGPAGREPTSQSNNLRGRSCALVSNFSSPPPPLHPFSLVLSALQRCCCGFLVRLLVLPLEFDFFSVADLLAATCSPPRSSAPPRSSSAASRLGGGGRRARGQQDPRSERVCF